MTPQAQVTVTLTNLYGKSTTAAIQFFFEAELIEEVPEEEALEEEGSTEEKPACRRRL